MPIAILKYRLPEEAVEFRAAQQGAEAKGILWAIDQHCRSLLKHGEPTPAEARLAEAIRAMIQDTRDPLLED